MTNLAHGTIVHRTHNKRTKCSYCNELTLFKDKGIIKISISRLLEWNAIINGRFCSLDCAIKYLQEARKKKILAENPITIEDCQRCKRFNDNPEVCFDFPEINIIEARKQCAIHDKDVCHGI